MQSQTSIRVSGKLLEALRRFKEERESYEDVIWDFIEPFLEISEEARGDVAESIVEYKRGDFSSLDEVKKEFGF